MNGEKNFGNEESLIIEDLWADEFNPDEAEAEIQSNSENDFDVKNETRDETLEKIFPKVFHLVLFIVVLVFKNSVQC